MNRDELLEAASQIGEHIARQALWDGDRCTWEVTVPDRANDPRRPLRQPAEAPLYQGTAGIAWFLAELYRLSGESRLARAAEGGLGHAVAAAAELPAVSFGFHSGRVGIAWVAARLAKTLGRPELRDQAWEVLRPLLGHESEDHGLDVIGGAAGAIPALVELAGLLERQEPLAMARGLGERLIAGAHREPRGWSWSGAADGAIRHLNGLAHGASGFGLALLELACASGESRYLFAAEMAFLYERGFFDPQSSNWPDLRNKAIGDYIYYGRTEELRQRLAAGDTPEHQPRPMLAWCHGAPGIGLARLRAFELTGQSLYREELDAALRSTRRSLGGAQHGEGNYSLCHGLSGNCELLLAAAAVLGDSSLTRECEEVAASGWERFGKAGRPWPCGTLEGRSDPSLLLGEAGIGYFFLRLAAPETPSPLLLRPSHSAVRWEDANGFSELAGETVEETFGATRQIFRRLAPRFPELPPARPGHAPLLRSPVETAYSVLEGFVEHQEEPLQGRLEDAFLPERDRYLDTLALTDFSAEFLRGLVRPPWEEAAEQRGRFQLAPGARLLTTRHDWDGWLAAGDGGSPTPPPAADTFFLLYREGNRMHLRRLGPFAAAVLSGLAAPALPDAVAEEVAAALGDGGGIDRRALESKVRAQLEQLYRAGFVDAVPTGAP